MKKLFLFGFLAFCGFKLFQHFSALDDKGPVAADGTPIAQLFIGPDCGQTCAEVEEILRSRNVNYELIDIGTPEGEKSGVTQYPLTRVGKQSVLGNPRNQIITVLAETYGDSVLTPGERMAMRGHFDDSGKPVVVLYATQWCAYCKRQREYFAEHNIEYFEFDVDASPSAKLAYNTLQGGGYPLTYVGYRRFDGYKDQEILDAVAALKRG